MSQVKFKKTNPVDTTGRYSCVALIDGEFQVGILDGQKFTYLPRNAFHNVEIDLSDAIETPGLEDEMYDIANHNRKMEAWRDAE